MRKWFRRLIRIELTLVFLVIIAGSVVRMTGSGMGCPDWPKCFGYLIPPTERSQLDWDTGRYFKEGQIIIVDEELRVAKSNFTTGSEFNPDHWAPYTKHDYALFNAAHTWTEYINRLFGALSGIPMIMLVLSGLWFIRKDWRMFALALMGLFLLGFEAWLGKLVVDGNLIPGSITIHMVGALSIVALLLVMLGLNNEFKAIYHSRSFNAILILALLMSIVQIIAGTQVREQIDVINETGLARSNWVESLDWQFYFHRSFSILIFATNSWLWWQNRRKQLGIREIPIIMILILIEIFLGVILSYFSMPKFAQPLHLVLGALMLSLQIYALIRVNMADKKMRISVD